MADIKGFLNVKELTFLTARQQDLIQQYVREINERPRDGLFCGKRLLEVRIMLTPYGAFSKVIKAVNIAQRTIYGYIYGYENAVRMLPSGAVEAMTNAGLTVNARADYQGPLGIWTEIIKKYPPPKKATPKHYAEWVEEIKSIRPAPPRGVTANRDSLDPEQLLRQFFRVLVKVHRKLPPGKAVRVDFLKKAVGVAMTQFDVDDQDFKPLPIPDELTTPNHNHRIE